MKCSTGSRGESACCVCDTDDMGPSPERVERIGLAEWCIREFLEEPLEGKSNWGVIFAENKAPASRSLG